MEAKTILSTFLAVFLAELGDKTQLATLALGAGSRSRLSVFLGAAAALVLASGLAVLAAGALTQAIPVVWLRRGAGVLMIVLGALLVAGRSL